MPATPPAFRSAAMAPERGGTDHCTVINNTLYGNDTADTRSGEFQMQFNMTNNVFENNIVYPGSRCLMTSSKSGPVDSQTPAVSIDYNLYYCVPGAEASNGGGTPPATRDSLTTSRRVGTTGIPVSLIPSSWIHRKITFACNQVLRRSTPAPTRECPRWARRTLKVERGPTARTSTPAATKDGRSNTCLI